jgi:hypothetical protein
VCGVVVVVVTAEIVSVNVLRLVRRSVAAYIIYYLVSRVRRRHRVAKSDDVRRQVRFCMWTICDGYIEQIARAIILYRAIRITVAKTQYFYEFSMVTA